MSHIEIQLGYLNIANVALKRIRKYCGKKNITGEEKEKYKIRFRGEKGIFII